MRVLLLALTIPITACGVRGAMQQATLMGQCAEGDAACSRRHPVAPLAIGARFYPEVATEISGTTVPNLILESAEPDILSIDAGALVAKRAGASAVLISTDDGAVVDFVHVWVAPITKITVARRDGDRISSAIGLAVGEDITLQPALWNGAQRLGGDADVTWTASNASPIAILTDGSPDRRRIRARASGKTTLTVALGDAHTTVDVEVVP